MGFPLSAKYRMDRGLTGRWWLRTEETEQSLMAEMEHTLRCVGLLGAWQSPHAILSSEAA